MWHDFCLRNAKPFVCLFVKFTSCRCDKLQSIDYAVAIDKMENLYLLLIETDH